MIRYLYILIGLVCFVPSTVAQYLINGVVYDSVFNWTITIPKGFNYVPSSEWKQLEDKGAVAIEATIGQEITHRSETIFVVNSGSLNFFE